MPYEILRGEWVVTVRRSKNNTARVTAENIETGEREVIVFKDLLQACFYVWGPVEYTPL